MKLPPPLWTAFAVPALYAFLAVFFLNDDRRDPKREPLVAAERPLTGPATTTPATGAGIPGGTSPAPVVNRR
ncbi:hypothetical protein [Luteolibacter luteus]|uniref:Uncharacterized protein n=1 Tax=Luteolibacter luteus TaxID=2728835 RepID=A0A858RMR5_9BACT|nr:hypothetical protein [Luteolibacter luteus]QJE97748.1 hypothetical protein HHL09_18830 [Luteolibacter luteus]